MFQEDYEKRSRSDKNLFSEVLNDLLYQCYICRKSFDRNAIMIRSKIIFPIGTGHFPSRMKMASSLSPRAQNGTTSASTRRLL